MFSSLPTRTPGPFCRAAFQLTVPNPVLGLFLPRCRTLPFPLLTGMRSLSAHVSSLLGSLWRHHSPLVHWAVWGHLQTCCCITYIINKDVKWDLLLTPKVFCLLLASSKTVPLITSLWAWLFSTFSVHLAVGPAHLSAASP